MSFLEEYELLDLIAENETRTYLARQRATVRMVMVHQLLPGPQRIGLLEMVLRTRIIPGVSGRVQVLDLGEHEGLPFVVTEIIPGFRTLREWLEAELAYAAQGRLTSEPRPAPSPDTSPPAGETVAPFTQAPAGSLGFPAPIQRPETEAQRDPGEFTQLFRAVMSEIGFLGEQREQPGEPPAATAAEPAVPPPPVAEPKAVEPAPTSLAEEPGEFTRMFQSGPIGTESASAVTPAAPASEPGEFTRMFLQAAPPSTPAPPSAPFEGQSLPESRAEPGEFTRMFQSPLAPAPLEPKAAAPFPGVPSGPPVTAPPQWGVPPAGFTSGTQEPAGAGEFTRIFGSPAASGRPVPPDSPAGITAGGATRLFASPSPPPTAPAPPAGAPGEFTRIVSAAPAEVPAPVASEQVAAERAATRTPSRYLPLYLLLGAVLLIAVLLVLYFALRP